MPNPELEKIAAFTLANMFFVYYTVNRPRRVLDLDENCIGPVGE